MVSFKNRWQIIDDEIINKKGKRIYVEKKIKNIMRDRYADAKIKIDSSYIYQKMSKLLEQKIYIPVWND